MADVFTKYRDRGAMHWKELKTRSIFKFNAHQKARYDISLEELGDINGKTVVDIGAGDGALTSMIVRAGAKVIAVDNEQDGLDLAKKIFESEGLSAEFVLGDAENVPLPDSSCDAVMSSDIIEHLDNPEKHLAEAARILRPGGVIVVTTPYRISEEPGPFHVHEFFPGELRELAAKYFAHVAIRETHHLFWYTLYNYRFRIFRRHQIGKYFTNMLALWFRSNPFLRDSSDRRKRDFYSQITLRGKKL